MTYKALGEEPTEKACRVALCLLVSVCLVERNELGFTSAGLGSRQETAKSVTYQNTDIALTREKISAGEMRWPCAEGSNCVWIPLVDSTIMDLQVRRGDWQGKVSDAKGSSVVFDSTELRSGSTSQEIHYLKIEFPAKMGLRNLCNEVVAGQQRNCGVASNAISKKQHGVKARGSFATKQMTAVLFEMPPHKSITIKASSHEAIIATLGAWGTKIEIGMRVGGGSVGEGSKLVEAGDVLKAQSFDTELYNLGKGPARLLLFIFGSRNVH